MNRMIAFILMPAFAICAYALGFSTFHYFSSPLDENLSVFIGRDTTLCQPGQRIDFRPTVSDPNVFRARWSPGTAVMDSTQLNTFGTFNESTSLSLSVYTISNTEMIVNGDFQQGNTGFTTDYQLGNSNSQIGILAQENTYAITTNPNSVHRRFASCTNHAGSPQIMVVNGSGVANNVWCQNVMVEPNKDYVFSAWLASMTDENPARLQFSINGILLGEELQASPTVCIWKQFFATWNSGSTSSAEICIVNVNPDFRGNDFALDDISFRPLHVARDTIQIDVAELHANWSGTLQFCSYDAPVDLATLLAPGATTNGIWTLDNAPIEILDPGTITPGNHQLKYTVQQAQCIEEFAQTITILEVRSAGTPLETAPYCFPSEVTILLSERLDGEDTGGIWTEISPAPSTGNAFNAISGSFNMSGQAPGLYSFRYTQSAPAGCNGSSSQVSILISPSPVADAGSSMTLDCTVDMLTIGGTNTSSGNEFSYQWTSLNGSAILSPNEALTEITKADTYILKVTHKQTGCSDTSSVVITAQQESPRLTAHSMPITCPDANNGQIIIDQITGGKAPFQLALNGNPVPNNQPIKNLSPGLYNLMVEDVNGCSGQLEFELFEPTTPNLTISTQEFGDSISLQIETDISPASIMEVKWSPVNCINCLSQIISPPQVSTPFTVTITDQKGCIYTATIIIEGKSVVEQAEKLFIPNAFSPNEDSNNDFFTIFSAKGEAANIRQMQILDRWGNLIFSKQNFPPDEPASGWDGTYKGQRLNTGVFIYFAEVEMTDGTVLIVQGDIALIH